MAFVGIRIHHLDLAFLDINEAIYRFAGPHKQRTRRISPDLARGAQCFDVSRCQRSALHLA